MPLHNLDTTSIYPLTRLAAVAAAATTALASAAAVVKSSPQRAASCTHLKPHLLNVAFRSKWGSRSNGRAVRERFSSITLAVLTLSRQACDTDRGGYISKSKNSVWFS